MEAEKRSLHDLLSSGGEPAFYFIPQYQRSYSWKKENWEALYDDIENNDIGYFMGAIICVLSLLIL